MKKGLLLTAAMASALTASFASAHTVGHFYAGLQAGLLRSSHSGDATLNDGTYPHRTIGTSLSFSKSDFAGGAFGGYQCSTQSGFLGVEGFYTHNDSKSTKAQTDLGGGAFALENFETTLSKKGTLGVTAKTGWKVPRKLGSFYISASILASQFDFTYKSIDSTVVADNAEGKESRTLWAFAPGVGFQHDINDRLSLRIDYQYRFYQDFRLRPSNSRNTRAGMHGVLKVRDHALMAGVSYKFSK